MQDYQSALLFGLQPDRRTGDLVFKACDRLDYPAGAVPAVRGVFIVGKACIRLGPEKVGLRLSLLRATPADRPRRPVLQSVQSRRRWRCPHGRPTLLLREGFFHDQHGA